jgi:dCTP diphosphatase
MDLNELTERVRTFAQDREWEQFHTPQSLLLAVQAELGELAEHFLWVSDQDVDDAWKAGKRQGVSEEIADVLIYLLRLADVMGIDIDAAVQSKIDINAEKYPVEKARGRSTKYTEL